MLYHLKVFIDIQHFRTLDGFNFNVKIFTKKMYGKKIG